MSLHLIKLSVGSESIEDLEAWQAGRPTAKLGYSHHRTRHAPKRDAEILDSGSIYWVIKGMVRVRQRVLAFDEGNDPDGTPVCLIRLERKLVPVEPRPFRPFQGWRYLQAKDAPPDLRGSAADAPPEMLAELRNLGLI